MELELFIGGRPSLKHQWAEIFDSAKKSKIRPHEHGLCGL